MSRRRPEGPAEALARAALDRALRVRRGERLIVESWSHALPWARAILVAAHRRGAIPTLLFRDEPAYFESLARVGASALASLLGRARREAPTVIRLDGPEAFPRLLGLPADDLDRLLRSEGHRSSRGGPRSRTLRLRVADVTPTAAARLGVALEPWLEEVVRASGVEPARLAASGRGLSRALRPGREVRVRHPNGTDLVLALARRPGWVETGVPGPGGTAELPSGRWVAPVAVGSARGELETNRASYDRFSSEPVALHGRLQFGEGRLRGFEGYRASQAFAAFVRSGKGRVRPLALEVGLNPEVRRAPEILDLAAGTVSLVVGDPLHRPTGRPPRLVFLASLAGADLSVDGRTVLTGGALGGRSVSRRAVPRAR